MARGYVNRDVFQAALQRITSVYQEGNRVIVAFSAGKDSGVVLELAVMAARATGNLPVEVMFRDDEILYPGTHEYAMRVASRPEIRMRWISCRQAEVNIYNRKNPFFYVYDERLDPDRWIVQPPPFIEWMPHNNNLYTLINSYVFPAAPGKRTVAVIGIRTEESRQRLFTIHSIHGARSYAPDDPLMFNLYPIYDWKIGDVWKSIKDNNWDYNDAYDTMMKMGISPREQRIAAAAMTELGANSLQIASKAWPRWFDKVCDRLPGIRQVGQFGARTLKPIRKLGETWEKTYHRDCIDNAPPWIRERSLFAMSKMLNGHTNHSTTPFPEASNCKSCGKVGSWKSLAEGMYCGDPFHIKVSFLPDLQPTSFRPDDTRLFAKTHKETIKHLKEIDNEPAS